MSNVLETLKVDELLNLQKNSQISQFTLYRVICFFRCTTWPRKSIWCIIDKHVFRSLSGVFQALNTEFGDEYVSGFAILSLFLILQPIKKHLAFFSGAVIPLVVNM